MMKKILLLFILTCSGAGSAFAQFDNSAWGNTLNGNASGSGGFVTIYSSLKPVDGTGSFTAVKVPSSNNYIEDVNISAWIATVPLSKRLKAKAGEPFTIDVHTAGYAGTNFANPSVGSPYWTVDTSDVYFPSTNPKMPNGIGQNGGSSKYSEFFSWEQKFPLNYYAPGNVNYEGYKKQFVFTNGSSEGYIVFRLVENEYMDFAGLGVAFPTGFSHTTLLLVPFVVEGPIETTIQPLGVITKPKIPKMVLHRPPGDQSTAFISSGQKTCRSFQESFEYTNDISGYGSIKWGVKAEVGIIVTQELEAYLQVTGSVGGGSVEIQTSETEECVEIQSDITLTSLDDGSPGGDVFIGYGFDAEYGMATNLYIDNNNAIQYNKGLYLVQQNPVRDFILSESGIIQDSLSNWNNIINNPSTEADLKQIARNQNDAWKKVLAANNANILAAKSGAPLVVKTFEGGVSEASHSETLNVFQTQTIETSSFISGGVAVDFLVEYGGAGVAGGVNWNTSSTSGASTTSSGETTTTIGYTLKDGDAGDKFNSAIYRDPVYGTTVFGLIGDSKTSCPFEGGYQRDQPKLEFRSPFSTTQKSATISDVSLGQAAQFPLTLHNESNEPRTYMVRVRPNSIIDNNFEVLAIGNSNLTTNAVPVNVLADNYVNTNITISRPQASLPTQVSGVVIEWYAECEPEIKDSLVINANWATPPPPVLGALPDPNPERNIYVCGAVPPIPLNASCSGGTKPYWYKSATGGLPLDPIETNSILDNNAADGDEYYVSCQSPNYISPRSFFGKVVFQTSPVVITESGPLSFCAPGSVTFNSYADNNNKALSLVKANSQYVEVPHSSSLNLSTSFTFEAWVNYAGENAAIIDKGNYDYLWMLNANGNANKMGYFERGIGWKYSNDAVPENTWTHVAITLQGGILRFYINGVESGSAFLGSAFQDNLPMNIGRQQPSSCQCNHFNGSMDELRLWNVTKSQAEIQASMKTGVSQNSAGLVAYYKFNEASGTSVMDATSNNNNGVLMNGASRQTAITVPFNELNVLWAPLNTTASSFTATTSGTYTASVNYGIGCSTSVNKTVSVNSNATLVSLSSPTDDFASDNTLKTASSLDGKIVATNKITGTARVNYQAKSLELNAGFIADSGTVFTAEIGGCP